MAQRSRRNKRRPGGGPAGAPDARAPRPDAAAGSADRYQKFLPEWMRGTNGAPPPRPARPRRSRPPRPAGGYTPGKFAGKPGDF